MNFLEYLSVFFFQDYIINIGDIVGFFILFIIAFFFVGGNILYKGGKTAKIKKNGSILIFCGILLLIFIIIIWVFLV